MHDFDAYFVDAEDLIHENQSEANKARKVLKAMSDDVFLNEMLRYPGINKVVGSNFPAYDIAKRIKGKGWTPSKGQRDALTNIYLFYLHGTY